MEQPLAGRRILVTRARAQASEFSARLKELGAQVVEIPTIQIVPLRSPELQAASESLNQYDWIIFTSANGVRCFFEQVSDTAIPPGRVPCIAAVGPSTAAAIEDEDLQADLVPGQYQAEGLLEAISARYGSRMAGVRILIVAPRRFRPVLKEGLEKKGARVDLVSVYETMLPEKNRQRLQQALDEPFDLVTFTSSSTVRNFVEMIEEPGLLEELPCAVIGPITAATARENQLRILIQPEDSTIPAFVRSIAEYFSGVS